MSDRVFGAVVEWRPIGALKYPEFNPKHRVSERYIRDIVQTMREEGFWEWNPILVTADGTVADGSRRLAAAKQLGIEQVPCLVVDGAITPEEVWGKVNARKNITSADALEAHKLGLPVEKLPSQYKSVIEFVHEIGGEDLVEFLVSHGNSPSVVLEARSLAARANRSGDAEFLNRTVRWLVSWNMQRTVRFALEQGVDIRKVVKLIEDNVPMTLVLGNV